MLIDVSSGRVLYAKNAREKRPPASLTKVMTALVCLEVGDLNDTVAVSRGAASVGGSSVWLEEGETHRLKDLLYGLVLRSGNDAAEAVAEHVAGSVDSFVLLMNRRAVQMGLADTRFCNPHGLPAAGHRTTAADLARIVREALLRPDFRRLVSTRRHVMPWPGRPWDRVLYNENRLLWTYPGADGVKTGWTREAGRCLIASATREGWQLAVVLLDAPEMWADAARLLDWGFTGFRPVLVHPEGAPVTRVRLAGAAERWVGLVAGREVKVAVLPGEEERVSATPSAPAFVRSPLPEGAEVGSLCVTLDGAPLASFPLVTAQAVPGGGLVARFLQDLWALLAATLATLFS